VVAALTRRGHDTALGQRFVGIEHLIPWPARFSASPVFLPAPVADRPVESAPAICGLQPSVSAFACKPGSACK
jgi:hypothetical protein